MNPFWIIYAPYFGNKTTTTHIYHLLGFHWGKILFKKFHQDPKILRNRCDQNYFVFFTNTHLICENSQVTLFMFCSSRQQVGERKCSPVVEVIFETMEGILHYFIPQNQRYGCDTANPSHRTDIKHVLKAAIFTPRPIMIAWMIFYVFLVHTTQMNSKLFYLQYDFL